MAIMELRKKSQITIPKEIIAALKLCEGDKLEINQKDGIIYMQPVCIYPKEYVDELEEIARESHRQPEKNPDITEKLSNLKKATEIQLR